MAIKISGTTVIDDSRVVSNVGGLKTVSGQSILGTGNITFASGLTVGSVQYTSYSPSFGRAQIEVMLESFVEPPSTSVRCWDDLLYTPAPFLTPTLKIRTKYRSVT